MTCYCVKVGAWLNRKNPLLASCPSRWTSSARCSAGAEPRSTDGNAMGFSRVISSTTAAMCGPKWWKSSCAGLRLESLLNRATDRAEKW